MLDINDKYAAVNCLIPQEKNLIQKLKSSNWDFQGLEEHNNFKQLVMIGGTCSNPFASAEVI